jgi:hypothetical protein
VLASGLLGRTLVNLNDLIAVRELHSGNRRVVVELFQNAGGSVAARCHLGKEDMPIVDGRNADEALFALSEALEGALLARAAGGRR